MFDISWSEMLIIAVIAVFVVGPKDIPKIMYTLGRFFRRFQYMRFAMSQQFDEILKAGDIEELRRGVNFEAKEPVRTPPVVPAAAPVDGQVIEADEVNNRAFDESLHDEEFEAAPPSKSEGTEK